MGVWVAVSIAVFASIAIGDLNGFDVKIEKREKRSKKSKDKAVIRELRCSIISLYS